LENPRPRAGRDARRAGRVARTVPGRLVRHHRAPGRKPLMTNAPRPSLAARHFAARGWLLAALFLAVLVARALTPLAEAPLRPEWLVYVAAALALRLWAGAHLGAHGNGARVEAPRLVRTGPYRL